VDLLFRRGHFAAEQVVPTAHYVMLFAAAIPLWAMQAILARAFYATGDTLTPMVAGTLVSAMSLPIYWISFHTLGVAGLVLASDVGIFLHTASLMLLLPRRLDTVGRRDIISGTLRGYLVGTVGAVPAWAAVTWLPHGRLHGHLLVVVKLAVGGLIFASLAALVARPLGANDIASFIEERILRRRRRALPSRT
jgi:putative peptidoglycan lipid II flippase